MPNKMNLLIKGLEFSLKQVTLPDASKPITEVKIATELDAGVLRKNPNHNVVSQEVRESDPENAELGTQEINLDIWYKNLKRDAGAHQIESNTLLESISQAIREQAAHFSSQPFGAGTDLVRIVPPINENAEDNVFGFRLRLIYNVLWG